MHALLDVQDMQEGGIAADTIMYNQVLGACAKANMVSECCTVLLHAT
jgi:pentatricopeptide repeat protein